MVSSSSYWLLAEDLGHKGDLDLDWNTYISRVNHVGVILLELDDELVWSWNGSNGQFTVESSYEAILSISSKFVGNWWCK